MDAFTANYPGCTELINGLTISGDDIVDLMPLSILTRFDTLSVMDNPLLTSLNGLNNINNIITSGNSDVSYILNIHNNSVLTDISALSGIVLLSTEYVIIISNNPALLSLVGLEWILYASDAIQIANNDSLINLNGLNNLEGGEALVINGNDSLVNLQGLESLTSNQDLTIMNNSNITNLVGLQNFSFGSLSLLNNVSLQTFDGLNTTGNFRVIIQNNIQLNDISVLNDATLDDFINIIDNPNLSTCNISSICNALAEWNSINQPNLITIENNAENCNSIAQVSNACGLIPSNDNCEGAIDLTIGETTEAYNEMATASPQTPSCNDTNRVDVWFTFNSADLTSVSIDVDADYSLQLWEGTCSSLTQVANACASNGLSDIPVTTNTDYYLQVWSDGTGRRATGLFNVVVQDATLSLTESAFDGFSYYPNPIKNVLNLKATQNIDALEVYNLLGQNVLALQPNASQMQMDMSTLSTGLYVLKATIGNQTETYKIVKE